MLLYVSSPPLFSNLRYTFNALAGTNKLNHSSLNIIDCEKLQHWQSIAIHHIYMWAKRFERNNTWAWMGVFLSWEEKNRRLRQTWVQIDLNIQTPAALLLRNTHRVADFCLTFFLHCSQLVLLIWASTQYFKWSWCRVMRGSVACFAMCSRNCSFRGNGNCTGIRYSEPAF